MATNVWYYYVLIYIFQGIAVQGQETSTSIYFLHIKSDIKYRFATTLVTSKVVNPDDVSREVIFDITLPNEAFMTNFTLEIDGKIHVGEVKEKEAAKQQYEHAKSQGQSAGHISAKPRETNKFNMAVNVEAMGKVTFNLTYQERLMRVTGTYKHVIYINPGQPVDDFQIEVAIQEPRNITSLNVPPIRNDLLTNVNIGISESNDIVIVQRPSPRSAYILYNPSLEEQRKTSDDGISGQFVVEYDVDRQTDAGDLLVVNGYFVHYFAFSDIEILPKDVLFILDKSGSMAGKKIRQLKDAMLNILDNIRTTDRFNIMTFDDQIDYWREGSVVPASRENIDASKRFIQALRPGGMTDINAAMTEGIKLLALRTNHNRANVLIFLTDGKPTSRENRPFKILENVLKINEVSIPIFSLAFGTGADYGFIKKVAAQNNGFGRKIYEDSDAALQIKGFYDEISTVLLKNVTFTYLNGTIDEESLTQSTFNTFFKGSEIMVAGKLADSSLDTVSVSVSGNSLNGLIQLNLANKIVPDPRSFNLIQDKDFESITEKLWAYLTIKQRLKEMEASTNQEEQEEIKKDILSLSLKYNFVTPLTSMVVTLPNTSDVIPVEDLFADVAKSDEQPARSPNTHHQRWSVFNRHHNKPVYLSPSSSATKKTSNHKRMRNRKRESRKKYFIANYDLDDDASPKKSKKRSKKKRKRSRATAIPTFMIKIDGIMEPLCVDFGLLAGRTYKLLQHSQSGTLIYATTTSSNRRSRQKRHKAKKVRRRHRSSVMVSRVVMETGGQSLEFFASKYSIDGTSTLWDTDTFALNVFNQNVSFNVDIIPTNGTSLHGDEQLQIYSDISSNARRLDGLLAHFSGVIGEIRKRKSRRGRTTANLNFKKGSVVYNKIKAKLLNSPSTVIQSCWYLKKNSARRLGIRPKLYENGSVL